MSYTMDKAILYENQTAKHAARRIAEAIKFNVDEFYLDLVTFERFSARQVRLWKRAELAGVVERVTVLVRPKMGVLNAR